MLGVWDNEYKAKNFIALRAKCYAYELGEKEIGERKDGTEYENENGFHITIAGVNKRVAIPALIERAKREKKDPLDYIKFGFTFDYQTCGKMLHTYIDEPIEGDLMDYQGHLDHYKEGSCVHLEPTKFDLNCPEIYLDFLQRVQEKGIIA